MMAWNYRPASKNQFHSWWYNCAALFQPIYGLLGFALMLRRCNWTKSGARLTWVFVGWRDERQ